MHAIDHVDSHLVANVEPIVYSDPPVNPGSGVQATAYDGSPQGVSWTGAVATGPNERNLWRTKSPIQALSKAQVRCLIAPRLVFILSWSWIFTMWMGGTIRFQQG